MGCSLKHFVSLIVFNRFLPYVGDERKKIDNNNIIL